MTRAFLFLQPRDTEQIPNATEVATFAHSSAHGQQRPTMQTIGCSSLQHTCYSLSQLKVQKSHNNYSKSGRWRMATWVTFSLPNNTDTRTAPGKHTIPSRWLHLHLLAWAVEEFHFWLLTYIKWYGLLCPFCDSVILFVWIFLVLWVVFFFGGGRYWLFLFPLYLIYFKVASTVHALLAPSSIYLAFSYLRPKLFHLVYILQSSTLQTELLQQYYVNQIHMLNKTVTHCNVYLSIIIQLPASIPHLPCE